MALVGQRHDVLGRAPPPGHRKDFELIKLLPQPSVEFSCTVEAQVIDLHDVPYGDLAVKCLEVNEESSVALCSERFALALRHGDF